MQKQQSVQNRICGRTVWLGSACPEHLLNTVSPAFPFFQPRPTSQAGAQMLWARGVASNNPAKPGAGDRSADGSKRVAGLSQPALLGIALPAPFLVTIPTGWTWLNRRTLQPPSIDPASIGRACGPGRPGRRITGLHTPDHRDDSQSHSRLAPGRMALGIKPPALPRGTVPRATPALFCPSGARFSYVAAQRAQMDPHAQRTT